MGFLPYHRAIPGEPFRGRPVPGTSSTGLEVSDVAGLPSDIFALSVEDRLDLVPALAGLDRMVEPLPGGLTNQNLKVTTAGDQYVARLARLSAGLLAIDRDAEYRNSVIAAAVGIAPAVVDYRPEAGVLVIRWQAGRTLEPADLSDPATLQRVAAACRRLHAGPRFSADFDMFDLQRRYLATATEHRFRLPDRYLDFTARWNQVRTVLAMDSPAVVPCHNDLLAANFIDDGRHLWLIDYEYSGNNDPCFELGNIWSEADLSDGQLDVLVDSYFGQRIPRMIARCRLQALVSQYGWTLWGVIQKGVSELDFDFWTWSVQKYERAVATFDSPQFPDLLAAAAGSACSPETSARPTTQEANRSDRQP